MKTLEQIKEEVGEEHYTSWFEAGRKKANQEPWIHMDSLARGTITYCEIIRLYDRHINQPIPKRHIGECCRSLPKPIKYLEFNTE